MAIAIPGFTCKFRTSCGGVLRCQDPVEDHGFCEFHLEAFLRNEIAESGVISDRLSDQERRREINYHGIVFPDIPYPG
ncbi:MAG: hypothetical protein V3U86_13325 [Acidobacteriota bacterium]|nr:hypothetical protein [Acidobacteriota bacterium]